MRDDKSFGSTITRRSLVAGAAVSAVALANESASAQGCPTPLHAKGPAVWLELDQKELDDAYDQSVYAFNAKNISERRAVNNEKVLPIIGKPERLAYGPAEIEKIDLWKTKRPNGPVLMFIHGGAWRGGRASQRQACRSTSSKARCSAAACMT
jgi:arylformamidase